MSGSRLPRRAFLSLPALALPALALPALALPVLAARSAAAQALDGQVNSPNGVTLLSSGPAYGYIAGWAKLLGPHLLDGLPPDVGSSFDAMGGPDGVTVCNAFGARLDPDGSTMMFAPGAALLAWLEGDSRVKYDPGHWIATVVGATPAVLVGRASLAPLPGGGPPLRLGASNPVGPELAAFLALDLLGLPAVPVYGPGDPDSLIERLHRNEIDLAFLSGPKMRDVLAQAAAAGAQALFSTGALGCDGPTARDPQLPAIPSFLEVAAQRGAHVPADDRLAAYEAAAAAACVCFAAVLPDLVRPSTLAEWRRGAELIGDSLSVAAVAVPQGVRLLTDACASSFLNQMSGSAAALDSLRRTMLRRYGWRAS
jgi:hypothetical protein